MQPKLLEAPKVIGARMQVLRGMIEAIRTNFVIFSCLLIPNVDHLEVANGASVCKGTQRLNGLGGNLKDDSAGSIGAN